ncbi:MAG: ksgA [Chloroflexi bacterium]|nr:ksgA [Chloroflexota bacterium]
MRSFRAGGSANTSTGRHPRKLLRESGAFPKRGLSQSFLADPAVARSMVQAADLNSSQDDVLEIGPGFGILTELLLTAARSVVGVELDASLASSLASRLNSPQNLRVVQADALHVSLVDLIDEPYVVVASLPYHVASPILFRLLTAPPRPQRLVVMLQEEVADRVVGRPGALTYLGAAMNTLAVPAIVRRVPPGAFFPPPKVRSAVVRLDVRSAPAVPVDDVMRFLAFVRAGFSQPRKQLHNSLAQGLGAPSLDVLEAARHAGIDPIRRPGVLSIADWSLLYHQFESRASS